MNFVSKMMNFLSKMMNIWIKNDEFSIQNDVFCIQNGELQVMMQDGCHDDDLARDCLNGAIFDWFDRSRLFFMTILAVFPMLYHYFGPVLAAPFDCFGDCFGFLWTCRPKLPQRLSDCGHEQSILLHELGRHERVFRCDLVKLWSRFGHVLVTFTPYIYHS